MKHHRNRSHDLGKHLRASGEAETKSPKLIDCPINDKVKELAAVRMDRDLKVSILQVDVDHPVIFPNGTENQLVGLHLEASLQHKLVQARQIYHRPPRTQRLPHYK